MNITEFAQYAGVSKAAVSRYIRKCSSANSPVGSNKHSHLLVYAVYSIFLYPSIILILLI